MTDAGMIWSYLSRGPLLWLTATLVAYWLGDRFFRAMGRQSWANPVLVAVILLALVLGVTGTDYQTYFEGAQFVHFMLGPATVALGMPLYENLHRVRRAALPLAAALVAGSVTAIASVLAIGHAFGLSPVMMASLAPKSTTAPVAIGIAEGLGGEPTITAARPPPSPSTGQNRASASARALASAAAEAMRVSQIIQPISNPAKRPNASRAYR